MKHNQGRDSGPPIHHATSATSMHWRTCRGMSHCWSPPTARANSAAVRATPGRSVLRSRGGGLGVQQRPRNAIPPPRMTENTSPSGTTRKMEPPDYAQRSNRPLAVDSKSSPTTPATTSTSSIRQLLGAADAQTAHPATFSTAPVHQRLGSANAETTPARALAAAANRTQRPDATCEGKNG